MRRLSIAWLMVLAFSTGTSAAADTLAITHVNVVDVTGAGVIFFCAPQ